MFLSVVLTSVLAQFSDLNPYRWPRWFVAACGAAYGILVLTAFRETRPISILSVNVYHVMEWELLGKFTTNGRLIFLYP